MNTKKLLIVSLLAIVTILLSLWFFEDAIRGVKTAPSLTADESFQHYGKGPLLIKEVEGGDMLLWPSPEQKVYRYNARLETLKPVPNEEWDAASGKIMTCPREANAVHTSNSYGRYTLLTLEDSNRIRTAIVSAAGPKMPAIFSFLPGQATGRIYGSRYVEVVTTDSSERKLLYRLSFEPNLICWTPNDRFIVGYDFHFHSVTIVDTVAKAN